MIATRILLTLRAGCETSHVPSHIDCLVGAGRPAARLDDGPVDRELRAGAGAFRASLLFASRAALGMAGAHHLRFDDDEARFGLSRTYTVELGDPARRDETIDRLRALSSVEHVRAQTLARCDEMDNDATSSSSQARAIVRAREALGREPGDERVTVAVVDTGVALGHPELQRRLLAGYDTVDLGIGAVGDMQLVGDSRGLDFNPRDEVGHGSHVAGVIGAHGWRVPPGIGGRSLIVPVRVLAAATSSTAKAQGSGEAHLVGVGGLGDIDCGLKVAVDLGAKVINMSFGTAESSVDPHGPLPHADVVRYAVSRGCILVAAAGNSGVSERVYPAALPEVIAVASVSDDLRRSSFSTMGDHIALAAPGERVPSLGIHGYKLSTGTSHAAPFVAGAAALLVAHARRRGEDLDGDDVRALLVTTAQAKPAAGRSPEIGAGVLDAAASLDALDRYLTARPATRRRGNAA